MNMMKSVPSLAATAFLLFSGIGHGQDAGGPTPYPKAESDWPGHGVIRVFPWMADNRNYFWKNRGQEQGAVVFIGDSLIGNWTSTIAAAFPKTHVVDHGIGGDVTRGVLFRLKEDVLDLHPKAIVILIGTNDLSSKEDSAIAAGNIGAILDQIAAQTPAPPVILCTLPPRNSPAAPIDPSQVPLLNTRIKALVKTRPNATLLDTYPLFAKADGTPDSQYFRSDLLHFAAPGYDKLRLALDPIFTQLNLE